MRALLGLILVAVFTLLPSCGGSPADEESAPKPASIPWEGATLQATVYTPRGSLPPGLLLVQQKDGDPESWGSFASQAQHEGYLCVVLELTKTQSDDPAASLSQIESAFQYLVKLGAAPENRGMVGAGAGADLALEYAAREHSVQALLLVSPGALLNEERGAELMKELDNRPCFFLSTSGDSFGAEAARRLKRQSAGFSELREYAGTARGADILATSDNAVEQVLNWLGIVLPAHKPSAR